MFKYYIGFHVMLFTLYACSMGSQKARMFSPRDIEKTFWVWCKPSLLKQSSLEIPLDSKEYACLRRCKEGKRNKLGKCKEFEVLARKFTDDKFYHGKWIIMPE